MANNVELQQQQQQRKESTELKELAANNSSGEESQSSDKENQRGHHHQHQKSTHSPQASLSNSIGLIKLDEISSFGATKQARLPALISVDNKQIEADIMSVQMQSEDSSGRHARSMPVYSADQLEAQKPIGEQTPKNSLPPTTSSKANENSRQGVVDQEETGSLSGGFQMVDMDSDGLLIGPSLPAIPTLSGKNIAASNSNVKSHSEPLAQMPSQQNSMQLGDSLIDMVVNLRNENQNLLQALQRNNDYVRQRLDEFKLVSEQTKSREEAFAKEKADLEHETRKLRRQNGVLSERLKSMEAKLKDMKLEVSDSLAVANSSRASSNQADFDASLYPRLEAPATLQMQMDVAIDELNRQSGGEGSGGDESPYNINQAAPMDTSEGEARKQASCSTGRLGPIDVTKMTKEELSKHFDADKVAFYSMDDRLKQCDKLEQQLNDIGNRDYEICLLQQQLNIYRQDFRLERMANLEAKMQIEKLKQEIDDLCLKRIQEKVSLQQHDQQQSNTEAKLPLFKGSTERFMGRVGKKAARSAAKAAKYAAKHAHLEEKAAAAASALAARYSQATAAATASAAAAAANSQQANAQELNDRHHGHHHHRRSHHHHHQRSPSTSHQTGASKQPGLKSEVVSDLWETANKAMRTGYKMASTHVNLALDKLTEFEQAQAANLAKNSNNASKQQQSPKPQQAASSKPSAPPMSHDHPSID